MQLVADSYIKILCLRFCNWLQPRLQPPELQLFSCRAIFNYDDYIRWIPFDEFKNIEYLAKGGFGEVHKATWIGDQEVVLERIHNSNDKIVDILKEVKQEFIVIITITLKQK